MPFSIELFFDTKSDLAVQKIGSILEKGKIPSIFSTLGATPHVSLAVFERFDHRRLHSVMKKLASSYSAVPFKLSSVGSFPGKEGVLFLAPASEIRLLEIHSWLHGIINNVVERSFGYYLPGQWVPHCTLALKLSPRKLEKGLTLLGKSNVALSGRYTQLALVETHPVHIRPIRLIYSIPFSGKK